MSSPLEIAIALHYVSRASDYQDDQPTTHGNSPAVRGIIDEFVKLGLLKDGEGGPHGRRYEPSEGLRVYAQELCSVPLPTMRWAIEWPTKGDAP